ncbi:MAG: hypothetical protein JWM35_201 [Verrucomicrobia bacterium]|nr:hypothetical protein [Verrucomicrobiota bacterium]
MPVLPKRFLTIGASLQTARMKRRLKETKTAIPAQEKIFRSLVKKFAATSFGEKSGVEAGMSYADFQSRVPLHTYDQVVPYLKRMKRGESNVLWPGECSFYAVSAGTTGTPKELPITPEMLAHFNCAGRDSLLYYSARVGNARVFHGRHLLLGGSTTLTPIPDVEPFTAYVGELGGLTALNMPRSVEYHLYEPGVAIAQMKDSPEKIAAIVQRTIVEDISLVAGFPDRLLTLADALRVAAIQGRLLAPNVGALWSHLECLVHGGLPISPYHDALRRAFGPNLNFHEVYPAAEGFIAAQDATASEGLRLMTDAGLFFEFLPMAEFEEARLGGLGPKAVALDAVSAGVDYALILTTPGGLCRYVLGDIVRFVSTEPPRIIYVGRTQLQLSAFGERVVEKEITDALIAVCQAHNWNIVNFHVAPLFTTSLTGQVRGRHEWWIELSPGTVQTPIGVAIAADLDVELDRRNASYAAKRKSGAFDMPVVRLVMPGVFEHWMRHNDRWGGQNKIPRSRNDRNVADGLAKIARFNDN